MGHCQISHAHSWCMNNWISASVHLPQNFLCTVASLQCISANIQFSTENNVMYIKITPILQIITTTKHVGYGNTINIEKNNKVLAFWLIRVHSKFKYPEDRESRRKTTKDDESRWTTDERRLSGIFRPPKDGSQSETKKTTKVERNTANSESERRRERCSGTSKTERINIHSGLSRPTPNEIVAKYTKQLNKIEKIIRNDLKDQLLLLQNAVAQQYQTNPSLTKRYCIFI